jgi:hypothetical protein
MDFQSNYKTPYRTEADGSDVGARESALRRLPQYVVCVGLGLMGGAVGVALAIGLAILIQMWLPPPAVFAPGVIPLMVTAVLAGLGASWLTGQMARHSWPALLDEPSQNGLHVILVSSVFASLAQVLFFFM